jgi:prepilin-type N-terminal cleavage/methylation domain-containing protein
VIAGARDSRGMSLVELLVALVILSELMFACLILLI